MAYKKVGWKDYPSTDTPINATNLDHMDAGILENAQTIGDKTKISGIGDGTVAGAIVANKSAIDANAEAIAQNTQSLGAIIPDYTKATKIFECVDYGLTKIDYTAPSDGYLNYKAFKGGILISYDDNLRFGGYINNSSYPIGGIVPIKNGTSVKISGDRNIGESSAMSEVWFISI